jgi:phosphoglycolate phosphatase
VEPDRSVYVGDDARDIVAGRAAGMTTIAAAYGYIVAEDSPDLWEADYIAADTNELAKLILNPDYS